jgi:phage tail sheath gpL-like
MTTLESVKLALRISTAAFDAELNTLIQAALMDMGVAGVTESDETNALILRAVITYCKANFGEPDEYDRLKRSYDEQKAQLVTATGYTEWGVVNG